LLYTLKYLSDVFPIQNGFETRHCFIAIALHLALVYAIMKVQEKPGGTEIKWDTSTASLC
jgi:hypothetical protein